MIASRLGSVILFHKKYRRTNGCLDLEAFLNSALDTIQISDVQPLHIHGRYSLDVLLVKAVRANL